MYYTYSTTFLLVWMCCQPLAVATALKTTFSFKNISKPESHLSCHKSSDTRRQPDSFGSKKTLRHNNCCQIKNVKMDSEDPCCDFTCHDCCFTGSYTVIPDSPSKSALTLSDYLHHKGVVTTPQAGLDSLFHPPKNPA